jgi:hypothetical protein
MCKNLPKKRAISPGRQRVDLADRSVCSCGFSCHVNGQGITRFGDNFPQPLVKSLARGSVVLLSEAGKLASGTVVGYLSPLHSVVLCAAHSIFGPQGNLLDLGVNATYTRKAPMGGGTHHADGGTSPDGWDSGELEPELYGAVERVMEVREMDNNPLDYAFLAVRWGDETIDAETAKTADDYVRTQIKLPSVGRLSVGDEVLLIGHPDPTKKHQAQATQCTAGEVKLLNADWANQGSCFAYASPMDQSSGYSGGGVFNSSGQLVGVLKGDDRKNHATDGIAFLDLVAAAAANQPKSDLLQAYVKMGPAAFSGK